MSTDGRFSAVFPRQPTETTTSVTTTAGPATQHVLGAYVRLSESYAITYFDFPAGSISEANSDAVLGAWPHRSGRRVS